MVARMSVAVGAARHVLITYGRYGQVMERLPDGYAGSSFRAGSPVHGPHNQADLATCCSRFKQDFDRVLAGYSPQRRARHARRQASVPARREALGEVHARACHTGKEKSSITQAARPQSRLEPVTRAKHKNSTSRPNMSSMLSTTASHLRMKSLNPCSAELEGSCITTLILGLADP
jgi:hypothetical protein